MPKSARDTKLHALNATKLTNECVPWPRVVRDECNISENRDLCASVSGISAAQTADGFIRGFWPGFCELSGLDLCEKSVEIITSNVHFDFHLWGVRVYQMFMRRRLVGNYEVMGSYNFSHHSSTES